MYPVSHRLQPWILSAIGRSIGDGILRSFRPNTRWLLAGMTTDMIRSKSDLVAEHRAGYF